MKKISIIIITILMLSLITIPVMAADSVATSLSLSGSEIKQSQEVTVTVKVNGITSTGTKALGGKISFDKDVLEFKSHEFVNGWAGAVSTDGTSFTVYTSSSTSIEEIVKLTFKVKSSAVIGNTKVSVNNVSLALEEGNGDPESEIAVSGSSATIKVVSSTTEPDPTPNPTPNPTPDKDEQPKPGTSKDPTTSTDKEHAETGLESTVLTTGIIMLALFSVVFYRKYSNINI